MMHPPLTIGNPSCLSLWPNDWFLPIAGTASVGAFSLTVKLREVRKVRNVA